jgi:type 1 glutamine amidotransferase
MKKAVVALCLLAAASSSLATDVLIYTKFGKSKGQFIHTCVMPCARAVKELAEEKGLTAVISDDPAQMSPENLKQYKTIVLASTNNEIVDTDEQRNALFDFVEKGGGLLSIHSGLASERKSERFRELVGATFVTHPPNQVFDIDIVDPAHPSVGSFSSKVWQGWKDEVYVCKMATNIHVVMTVDLSKLKGTEAAMKKGFGVVPVAYTVPFGKGRVYVVALGHNDASYQTSEWRRVLQDSLLWTIGGIGKERP